jgi:GNAT superfamily N-acetyltransferase
MATTTTAWHLTDVSYVASLDDAAAWAYHGIAEVERAHYTALLGDDDLADTAQQVHTDMAHQQYERTALVVAVLGSDGDASAVVGHAAVVLPQTSNPRLASMHVVVHPDHRGRGIGTALLERAEAIAAAAGRTVLQAEPHFAREPGDGEPGVEPSTGSGRVPAETIGFQLRRGYRLEQVERRSVLPLPVEPDRLDAFVAEARSNASGYRSHTWWGSVPDEWLDAFALLETRMSTDAPLGGLAFEEDPYDAGRVRDTLDTIRDRGDQPLTTAVEHEASGELAGMTMFVVPDGKPFAFQWDTIVLHAHRGHRLGMLVKALNLQELARTRPDVRRVHTWNAEENDHMLGINVALGFRPAGGAAVIQKLL